MVIFGNIKHDNTVLSHKQGHSLQSGFFIGKCNDYYVGQSLALLEVPPILSG